MPFTTERTRTFSGHNPAQCHFSFLDLMNGIETWNGIEKSGNIKLPRVRHQVN